MAFKQRLLNVIYFITVIFLIWFIVYFMWGKFIPIEWSNTCFASFFPKLLAFITAALCYISVVSFIKIKNRFSWRNIGLFILALIIGFVPIVVFGCLFFYSSQNKQPFWKYERLSEKSVFYKKFDHEDKIVIADYNCDDGKCKKTIIQRIKPITPVLNYIENTDTTKLDRNIWIQYGH